MGKVTRASALALFVALRIGSANAGGGGMGSIVFDPTALVQTSATAANSAKQMAYQYQQMLTQYQQYANMVQQARNMDGVAGIALGQLGFTNIQNINQALRAYTQLGTSISQTQQIYTQRLDEAKLMGVSWSQYVAGEQQRISTNQRGAASRVQAEIEAFKRVEEDYQFARETADKIPMTPGVHAAQQQTNGILNRMITQNAEIIRTLAQANGSQRAEEMIQKDMDKQRSSAALAPYVEAQNKVAIDPKTAVDAMLNAAKKPAGKAN